MMRREGRPVQLFPGGSGLRRHAPLAILALLVPLLAGCALFFPGTMIGSEGTISGPGMATPFGDGMPSVRATYVTGSATLKITQSGTTQKIQLDRVGPGSELRSMIGAEVTWRSENGWIVRVQAYGDGTTPGSSDGHLTIDRINNHDHWTTQDYDGSDCAVNFAELSDKVIDGTGSCKKLRWLDALAGQTSIALDSPPYIAGQAPFDAEVTFEAKPAP